MKNFLKYLLLMLLIMTMVLSGCSKSKEVTETDGEDVEEEIEVVDSETVEEVKEGVPSPISGIYVEESKVKGRPFAVMLDNQAKARPQAGLDQAEIIYEILAEGGITRYMAIFLTNEPQSIGPVRSARPYYIDKALEYNALYVHVGGSPQAFEDIKNLKIADIDAMSRGGSIFWRKNHKSRPHNMYTSTEAIRKAANDSNYYSEVEYQTLKFNEDHKAINGEALSYLKIPYFSNYSISFKYNEEENSYFRYINGKPHVDEISENHLSATNIIVQVADTKVIDSEGRLKIGLVGQGTGKFITNGEARDINWEKKSRRDITRFYYGDGTEIVLNPGVTWIQVVPKKVEVVVE